MRNPLSWFSRFRSDWPRTLAEVTSQRRSIEELERRLSVDKQLLRDELAKLAEKFPPLRQELLKLAEDAAAQRRTMGELQRLQRKHREDSELFDKAFRVNGFNGDYIEFGSYRGDSLIQAYYAARRVMDEVQSGAMDHSFDDKESVRAGFQKVWDEMRFFCFDSFQGMPQPAGIDTVYQVFPKGSYACSEAEFREHISRYLVPEEKVIAVPGFFRATLTEDTARALGLKRLGVVHIDSDLYESARDALAFCTPYLTDGTVVVFDEWFQFRGNPTLGEQRAFREWRALHPEWLVTPFHAEGPYRNSFILSKSHDQE